MCFLSQIKKCIKYKVKMHKYISGIGHAFKSTHNLLINVLAIEPGLNAYIL